jgi:hypothetical protein
MNFVQRSILKTREAIFNMQRRAALTRKHDRQQEERSSAAMELLIDDIVADTGLELSEKNLPTIALFVQGILQDRANANEEKEWDGESFL